MSLLAGAGVDWDVGLWTGRQTGVSVSPFLPKVLAHKGIRVEGWAEHERQTAGTEAGQQARLILQLTP